MATVTVKADSPNGEYAIGNDVTLTATADGSVDGYQWLKDGAVQDGKVQNPLTFKMTADDAASYVARAKIGGQDVDSAPVTIKVKSGTPAPVTPPANTTAPEPPPTWHFNFAVLVAIVVAIVVIATLIFVHPLNAHGGLSDEDWKAIDAKLKVALSAMGPLIVIGVIVIFVGLWMTLVEWRGRFAETTPAAADKGLSGSDVGTVIDAVGKLRGATLAMVVGGLLLLGAAWIGQAAGGSSTPAATPTPAAAPANPGSGTAPGG
jgi:hypothetical protein